MTIRKEKKKKENYPAGVTLTEADANIKEKN